MTLTTITLPGPTGTPVLLTWGTPVTNDINEMVGILTPPVAAWTAYTPIWASSGTQPALVNGTLTGRYMRFGKVGFFNGVLSTGSSTTYGTGTYTFSLPVGWTAASTADLVGSSRIFDTSTVTRYLGALSVAAGNTSFSIATNAAITEVSGTVPITFATTDVIRWQGVVELT